MQELFKNPVVIGIGASIITYLYLYWDAQQKLKKYPKAKQEPINIMTPLIVGLLVFVIMYNLLGSNESIQIPAQALPQQNDYITQSPNKLPTVINIVEPVDSSTFHMVGKNTISLPQHEIFIDLAKF